MTAINKYDDKTGIRKWIQKRIKGIFDNQLGNNEERTVSPQF